MAGNDLPWLRVLCFGGRDFNDKPRVFDALAAVEAQARGSHRIAVFHGGARGADSHSGTWAAQSGYPVGVMPANWDFFAKSAGRKRNEWMLEIFQPNYAVQFPGGNGTAHMGRILREAGILVWEPYPQG